uniref:Uncharacterized protein n=1 Tax=Arundo donax TaxID=35708 RepID=A0A0A9EEV3_ARUDO
MNLMVFADVPLGMWSILYTQIQNCWIQFFILTNLGIILLIE